MPGAAGSPDVVVIGHGCTSDRDRPWSLALSAALQQAGIASLRITFAGNGESEGRFEDATITKEVGDLGAVVEALAGHRVHYVGHSMGGSVGLLRAAVDARIRTLVSLAAVTHTREFILRLFGRLQPGEPMLGKPHCPWNEQLRDDFVAWGSLAGRAPVGDAPWLIVHGTADDVVPVEHSRDLHAAAPARSELVLLDGVDHSFTGAGLGRLTQTVCSWLSARLGALR